MSIRRGLLVGCLSLVATSTVLAQPPGGGRGGFDMGAMMRDPDQMFNFMAKGKDVISRNDLNGIEQMMFDRFAQRLGLTSGTVTREQFRSGMQQAAGGQQSSGGFGGGMPSFGGRGDRGDRGGDRGDRGDRGGDRSDRGGDRGDRGGAGGFNPDMIAEMRFRRADEDGDGLLRVEEMTDELATERDKWDQDGDGFIDLNEYKPFVAARIQQMQAERGDQPGGERGNGMDRPGEGGPTFGQDPKRTIVRAGNLPRELSWFASADANSDGQVSILEWRGAQKDITEFKSMDRSGDNLLTAEEALLCTRLKSCLLYTSPSPRD